MVSTRRLRALWVGAVVLLCPTPAARSAPGTGTLTDPVVIDDFPYAVADDTTGRGEEIDTYACNAALDESGPEVVYRLTTPSDGRLVAWVVGDDYVTTDIDVHLLGSTAVSGGEATDCIARANLAIEEDGLPAGTYTLVVDSYVDGGTPLPGPYELRVDFIPYDTWRERPIARGVVWRQRLYPDLYGGFQTVNVLAIDPTDPDVSVEAVDGDGCETPASMGERVGAVAAINAGFFTFDAGCSSVSLLKIEGQLLATQSTYRVALGVTDQGQPIIDWVDAGQDWPAAYHAIGGVPRLMASGQIDVTWEAEGSNTSFVYNRHPRTAACIDGGGQLHLVTFDGRTAAGAGIALDDLAQWFADQGCVDAMNLDGGGSTSMWIADQPFDGVVSYPSDNSTADHAGSCSVSNAFAVFAAPYNHPPRFTTAPATLTAEDGVGWAYDADALDLDVYDTLGFGLGDGPAGMVVDAVTGEVTWTPGAGDGGSRDVTLTVTDGAHVVEQTFTLLVDAPPGPDAGLDAGPSADAADASDTGDATPTGGGKGGCGCQHDPERPALPLALLLGGLLALVIRRRRR